MIRYRPDTLRIDLAEQNTGSHFCAIGSETEIDDHTLCVVGDTNLLVGIGADHNDVLAGAVDHIDDLVQIAGKSTVVIVGDHNLVVGADGSADIFQILICPAGLGLQIGHIAAIVQAVFVKDAGMPFGKATLFRKTAHDPDPNFLC